MPDEKTNAPMEKDTTVNTPPVDDKVKEGATGQVDAETVAEEAKNSPPGEQEKQPTSTEKPASTQEHFSEYNPQEKSTPDTSKEKAPGKPVAPSVYTHEKEITEKLPELVTTFENARASGLTDREMANSLNFIVTNARKTNEEQKAVIEKQAAANIASMQDYKARLQRVKDSCGEESKAFKVVEASAKDNPKYLEAIEELLASGKTKHHDPSASFKKEQTTDKNDMAFSPDRMHKIWVDKEVPNRFTDYNSSQQD